jgi:predicted GNAT family acetyltransferase
MAIDPQDITLEDGGGKARYLYRIRDDEAVLSFTKVGESRIIIDHTEVPAAFRGQGVGPALVARAVADARAAGKAILPLCPFAASQFRRHPEWQDVLDRRRAS